MSLRFFFELELTPTFSSPTVLFVFRTVYYLKSCSLEAGVALYDYLATSKQLGVDFLNWLSLYDRKLLKFESRCKSNFIYWFLNWLLNFVFLFFQIGLHFLNDLYSRCNGWYNSLVWKLLLAHRDLCRSVQLGRVSFESFLWGGLIQRLRVWLWLY